MDDGLIVEAQEPLDDARKLLSVPVEEWTRGSAEIAEGIVAAYVDNVPALLDALEEAQAKLALTYDDLYADALVDARSDAQDFESDLWREVRKYLTELNLDWLDYADDGILAEDAIQYIRDCMDEETRRADAAEAKLAQWDAQDAAWAKRVKLLTDRIEAAEAKLARMEELVAQARLLVDTGFSQFGETVNYAPSVTARVMALLDAALQGEG